MKTEVSKHGSNNITAEAVHSMVHYEIVAFEDRLLDYLGDNFADLGTALAQCKPELPHNSMVYPWEITLPAPSRKLER